MVIDLLVPLRSHSRAVPAARAVFSVPHPAGKRTPSPKHPLGTLGSAEFLPELEHSFLILATDVPQAPRSPLLCHPLGPRSFGTYLWTVLFPARVTHCPSSDRQCLVHQLLACLLPGCLSLPCFPHRKQNGLFRTQARRSFPCLNNPSAASHCLSVGHLSFPTPSHSADPLWFRCGRVPSHLSLCVFLTQSFSILSKRSSVTFWVFRLFCLKSLPSAYPLLATEP